MGLMADKDKKDPFRIQEGTLKSTAYINAKLEKDLNFTNEYNRKQACQTCGYSK